MNISRIPLLSVLGVVAGMLCQSTLAQNVEVYKRDILVIDVNTNSLVDPGDTIEYEITIYNPSSSTLTGVVLTDTLPSGVTTSGVASIELAPIASNDAYSVVGNVGIDVPAGSGALINDSDPDGGSVTVTSSDTNSTQGGVVSMNADGSFTYDPPAGFTGADSFDYTITDDESDTDTGTVNLTVNNRIWFLDNTAAAGGNGTLDSPFDGTAAFNSGANDQVGDVIFVDQGNGSNAKYRDGFILLNNQRLLGQSIALNTANTGITFPPHSKTLPSVAGPSQLAKIGGPVAQLASGNTVRGFGIQSISGTAITGAAVGTLTISSCTLQATSGSAISLAGGTSMAVSLSSIFSSSASTPGINVTTCSGSFAVTGLTDLDGGTATGINLVNNPSLDVDFNRIDIDGANVGINISGGISDFDVSTSTAIDGNSGTGIIIANCTGRSFDFADTDLGQSTPPGSDGGINIATGNAGATFSFTDLDITNLNGTGLHANNSGTINCTAQPDIISTGGPAVDINNTTGNVGGGNQFAFNVLRSTDSTSNGIRLINLSESISSGVTEISNAQSLSSQHGIYLDALSGGATFNRGYVRFTGAAMNSHGVYIRNSSNVSILGTAGGCIKGGVSGTCFEIMGVASTGIPNFHGVYIENSNGTRIQYAKIHDIGAFSSTGFSSQNYGIYLNNLDGRSLTVADSHFEDIGTTEVGTAVYVATGAAFNFASSLTFTGNTLNSLQRPIDLPTINGGGLTANWNNNLLQGSKPTEGFALQFSGSAGSLIRNLIAINSNVIEDITGVGIAVALNDNAEARLECIGNTLDAVKTSTPSVSQFATTGIEIRVDKDVGLGPTLDFFCENNIIKSTNPGMSGLLGWLNNGIYLRSESFTSSAGSIEARVSGNTLTQVEGDVLKFILDGGPPLDLTLINNSPVAVGSSDGFEIDFTGSVPVTADLRLSDNNVTGDYDLEAPSAPQVLNLYCPTSCPATSEAEIATLLNAENNQAAGAAVGAGNVDLNGSGSIGNTTTLPTLPN